MLDVAVTTRERRLQMVCMTRDAARVVVEVFLVGEQIRSARSKMFGSEKSGARLAEERVVADAACDARDEARHASLGWRFLAWRLSVDGAVGRGVARADGSVVEAGGRGMVPRR